MCVCVCARVRAHTYMFRFIINYAIHENVRVILFKKTTIIKQQQRVKRDVYASVGIAVSTFCLKFT